ncbi:hypothetical protein ACFE04_026651 [Oxalis oulophora]
MSVSALGLGGLVDGGRRRDELVDWWWSGGEGSEEDEDKVIEGNTTSYVARRWICGVMVMVRLCIHNHGGEDGGGGGLWIRREIEVGKGFVMDIIGKQCVCEDIIGVCDGQWVCCRPSGFVMDSEFVAGLRRVVAAVQWRWWYSPAAVEGIFVF